MYKMDCFYFCAFTILILQYLWCVGCDRCDTCRRHIHTCHTVSGAFTKHALSQGYNFIARIPAGACSINITELAPSSNYIALKTVRGSDVLNSQWAITSTGNYHRGGTILKYGRGRDSNCPGECVLALGPTNDAIEFQVLAYHTNPGILYEYQIPGRGSHRRKQNGRRHHGSNWKRHHQKHPHKRRHNHFTTKPVTLGQTHAFSAAKTVTRDFSPKKSRVEPHGTGKDSGKSSADQDKNLSHPHVSLSSGKSHLELSRLGNKQHRQKIHASATRQSYHGHGIPKSPAWKGSGGFTLSGNQDTHQNRKRFSGYKRRRLGYQALTLSERSESSGRTVNTPSPRPPPAHYLPLSGYATSSQQSRSGKNFDGAGSYIPYRENLHLGTKYPSWQSRHNERTADTNLYQPDQGNFPKVLVRETPKYISPYGDDLPYGPNQPLTNKDGQKQPAGLPVDSNSYFDYKEIPEPTEGLFPERRGGHNEPLLPEGNSYLIPHLPAPDTDYSHEGEVRTIQYSWRISGFTNCSEECGGGVQETLIICVKGKAEAIVTEDNCDARLKPDPQQVQCNTKPCPPQWETGEWTECSVTCGSGLQSRRVECKKRVSASLQIGISADLCPLSTKPSIIQQCGSAPCSRWNVHDWGPCSVNCGKGERQRTVECVDNKNKAIPDIQCKDQRPASVEKCHRGACNKHWYYTDWSDQCSSDCGPGVTTRQVVCMSKEGRVLKAKRCHHGSKPANLKSCQLNSACGGQWFVGPWKQCSSVCGKGLTSREVVCMKSSNNGLLVPVSDAGCDSKEKPATEKVCHGSDCGLHWYMTDWSKCSVSCGSGEQSRQVRCLDGEQTVSADCEPASKPPTTQSCSQSSCGTETNNTDESCKDQLKNCIVVAQARLCRYKFYKSACCATCSKPHH